MKTWSPPVPPELARVIEVNDRECVVTFVTDGRTEHARLSPEVVRYGIRVQPGHLVLVAEQDVIYRGPPADAVARDLEGVRERYLSEWEALSQRVRVTGDLRQIVAEGYNRIAERYAQWSCDEIVDSVRPRYLSLVLDSLPAGADVLELGCGGGAPTTQRLAERFALTGVDISERQVELARQAVPHATFVCDDMTRVSFPSASFDAVAAIYAFNHLPFGELPTLLGRIADWLKPNGILVAAFGSRFDPGTVETDWLGVPMYFSGYAPDENRRFVEGAGLRVVSLQPETILENGRRTEFLWVVARKP